MNGGMRFSARLSNRYWGRWNDHMGRRLVEFLFIEYRYGYWIWLEGLVNQYAIYSHRENSIDDDVGYNKSVGCGLLFSRADDPGESD